MPTRTGSTLTIVALLLLALLAAPAHAGIVIPMADDDLIRGADVIVQGRITKIESHRDPLGTIETYITVAIEEMLKGSVPGATVTFREIGGTVGDRSYWVFANAQYAVGERIVLFMDQRDDGTLRTYQFYLGKFTIVTDPATGNLAAVRGVPKRVTVVRNSASALPVPHGAVGQPLDQFKQNILAKAGEPKPLTLRPRPVLPFASASAPPSGTSEDHQEFRFLADPNPPTAPNPSATLLRWFEPDTNTPVVMRINSTGQTNAPSLGFDQIRAAFRTWSRVPTSAFRFAEGTPTTAVGFQGADGVNAISFRDPLNQIAAPSSCSGVLAIAGVSLATGPAITVNGRLFNQALQGDLVVNDGWDACGVFYQDFENFTEVITHELGHVLGLGHSEVSTVDPVSGLDGATMEAFAHFDGRSAVLHADDKAGVTFIYPGNTLTIAKTGAGSGTITSSVDGIDCGTDCVAGFAVNSTIDLAATPDAGSTFGGFVEAGCGTSVTMSTNLTCTAIFTTDPDLVISAISGPAAATPGSMVTLNNTAKNNGLPAGTFTVGLYLSNSSTITTALTPLATRVVAGGLATNATSADATMVTIPADTPPGSYFLGAIADINSEVDEVANEGNNTATTPIAIGRPDLVVTALTATPATVGTGLTITATTTVKNQAAAPITAGPSTLAFYLSLTGNVSGATRLAQTRAIPSLAKDATSVGPTTLTIPANQSAGSYFLIAMADDLAAVDEQDEGNNTRNTATTIAVSRPNFQAISVTATPTVIGAGANVSVTHVVKNVATAPANAPASLSRLSLSSDNVFGGDVDLGTVPVGALNAGVPASVTKTGVTIPAGTAPGLYWIFVNANDGEAIPEATTTNNVVGTAQPITVGPDLTVTAATASTTSTAPGATVNVTNTVKNVGSALTAQFDVSIYLSVNNTFDGGDVFLTTRRVTTPLPQNSMSGPVATPVVIPANTSAGTYFLLVRADAGAEVAEANENNNVLASAMITVVKPDLTVLSVTVTPTAVAPGANVSITHVVKNVAAAAGLALGSTTRLSLSSDATLDGGDVTLADVAVGTLAGGAQASVTKANVQIPAGTAPGLYFIIAEANVTGAVSEAVPGTTNVKATATPIIVGPDLTVTAATPSPASVLPGGTINVSNTVKNQGGQAAGAFIVAIYLSANNTFEGGDLQLANRSVVSLAAAAMSGPIVTPVVIPAGTAAGDYFLIVRADDGAAVSEANEGNNVLATVKIKVVKADLSMVSVTATPTAVAPGANVSVTHVVKNIAPSPGTATPTTTRLLLSVDALLDGGDVMLADAAVGALAGGVQASVTTKNVQIPAGTAPGLYFILAQANVTGALSEAGDGSNNTKATAAPIIVGPDLIVTAATASPAAVAPGGTINVSNTVKNQGGQAAGAFGVGIYLSADATFDGGDLLLANRSVTSLAAAAMSTVTTPVPIPANTVAGTYFLLVRADFGTAVTEGNETNNVRATAAVQVVRPDLSVLSVTATPTAVAPGANISVTHVVKNVALMPGPAAATVTQLFLSADATLDGGDTLLASQAVGALAGGAQASLTTKNVNIPSGTPTGLYFVIAQANATGTVTESESGVTNVKATATPIIVGPDLLVTAATPSPAAVAPGGTINVTNTVKNQGSQPATAFEVGLYLSSNNTFDGGDLLLANRSVTGLAVGAMSGPVVTPVVIPSDTPGGAYFLLVRADFNGVLTEANENNNVLATVPITVVRPDLSVLSVTFTPATVAPGANVSVTHVVKNLALSQGPAPATVTQLFLSTDPVLDGGDTLLASRAVGALMGGAQVSLATPNVTIPGNTSPGRYFVIAQANATAAVTETGTGTNNIKASATQIVVGPDLVVTTATAPATAKVGLNVSVTTVIKNVGGQTAGASAVSFFLGQAGQPDVPLAATRAIGSLAPNAMSPSAAVLVTIPVGTTPGTYFIRAQADGPNAVAEADETNNVKNTANITVTNP